MKTAEYDDDHDEAEESAADVAKGENVRMLQGEAVPIRTDTNQREEIRGHTEAMEAPEWAEWEDKARKRLVQHVIAHVQELGQAGGKDAEDDRPDANHAMRSAMKKSALTIAIE